VERANAGAIVCVAPAPEFLVSKGFGMLAFCSLRVLVRFSTAIVVTFSCHLNCFADELFSKELPTKQWNEAPAAGFPNGAVIVVNRKGGNGERGVPLGGIGTGYITLDPDGTFREWTIYNNLFSPAYAQKTKFLPGPQGQPRPLNRPFLGLAVDGETTVLALQAPEGLKRAEDIRYWGHFPVADLEYDLAGPVGAGLRAWSPFVLGDDANSNVPAVIYEVHLRNHSDQVKNVALAISIDGPDSREIPGAQAVIREAFVEPNIQGVSVTAATDGWPGANDVPTPVRYGYTLAVLDGGISTAIGAELGDDPEAWSRISETLPSPAASSRGSSLKVQFKLSPGEERIVHFVSAWHAPFWPTTRYINQYKMRFDDSRAVSRYIASNHQTLLDRTLSWQRVVFDERDLPASLRYALVNLLHTLTKASSYVAIPGGDPNRGFLSLMEAGRFIMLQETNCIAWWGDWGVTFFYPELRVGTLRALKAYQLPNGQVPFALGSEDCTLNRPFYGAQHIVNGILYTQMVARLVKRTNSQDLSREFYGSVKRAIEYSMTLDIYGMGLVSIDPSDPHGQPWDSWQWRGNAAWLAGNWLCSLQVAKEMAVQQRDDEFAKRCEDWLAKGKLSLEKELWNDPVGSYYLFRTPDGAYESDSIMSLQIDASYACRLYGLPDVFPRDRRKTVLHTIKQLCVDPIPAGAANAMRPDGTVDTSAGVCDSRGIWLWANALLAGTYAYNDQRETAISIVDKSLTNLMLQQELTWDFPQGFQDHNGTGKVAGDYYSAMSYWAIPPALKGQSLKEFTQEGGLVARMIKASAPQ
jgi:uncharacterized protein (DUF608 family)